MSQHTPDGPLELGAEMDYPEHQHSYHLFLEMAKYGALHVAAILIAMAFAFFTSAGFISGLILFLLISAIGIWFLR